VEAFRPLVEHAVHGSGLDPELIEAIVFLESGGRPDAIAGGQDVANASGLTPIVAQTGTGLPRMSDDLARSQKRTDATARARPRGDATAAARLEAQRRAADPRFDPARALAGTVRYLTFARDRLGREDLAVVSYHMGVGNLEAAIRAYTGDQTTPIA